MHLPDSHGFTHILVGVEAISSYVVLYPMKGVTVDQVIKCLHQHLTLFPHFKIARTDQGPEFGRKFTQFLATHSIVHAWTIPSRSQVCGQAEISIRITRSIINKIVDASSLNRHNWFKMLPFITNSLNKGQLSGAQGLTRSQLLFSPFVQQCGLPAEGLFMIQERLFKKIITNRQNLLLKRQSKIRTDNSIFEPGQLVFKKNEVFENVSFPKSKPTAKELFMIVFIPNKKIKGDTHHRVSQSSFKVWVRNLRTDKISATWSSNLRLVRVTDLAYMQFDPFTYLGAQLKRLGSAEGNQDRGLFLLGRESRVPDTIEGQDQPIVDTNVRDQTVENTDTVFKPKSNERAEHENALGARPKRVVHKPKKFEDYEVFSGTLESMFIAANLSQRSANIAALQLHLEICCENCKEHDMFLYLVEQGKTLEPNYGELTKVESIRSKKKINKRVQFANKVHFQDGSRGDLHSFKITLHFQEQIYLFGSYFLDCSIKELAYVKLLADF